MIDFWLSFCYLIALIVLFIGLFFIKPLFIKLAKNTVSLLNTILDEQVSDKEKQTLLIQKTKRTILYTILFFFGLMDVVILAYVVTYLYEFKWIQVSLISWEFGLASCCIIALQIIVSFFDQKTTAYSNWSKLLHHLILDNYNIQKALFKLEKRKVKNTKSQPYLIVTGLARSGTTAFTETLYNKGQFRSLGYQNMPFLLSVNLWKKFYNPKSEKQQERAHQDGLQINLNSIEALEEHFYKVHLNDDYIKENNLVTHQISPELIKTYQAYQATIQRGKKDVYLAKNNNHILRLKSMLQDENMYTVVLFRNPIQHALSLNKQHQKFTQSQTKDPFTLTYMNWLGHHEFGLNHLPFDLQQSENSFQPDTLNYWLQNWVSYYEYASQFKQEENIHFIAFEQFCEKPEQVLSDLNKLLPFDGKTQAIKTFTPSYHNYDANDIDMELKLKAEKLYQLLLM